MRSSDWSSDVCSSDLWRGSCERTRRNAQPCAGEHAGHRHDRGRGGRQRRDIHGRSSGQAATRGEGLACQSRPGVEVRTGDRKSVVEGKSVSVRVDLGGRRIIKKKNNKKKYRTT